MRRRTRLFLLAGCAFILTLELPVMLADLAQGWRGPYVAPDWRSAVLERAGAPAALLALRLPQVARR